LKFAKTDQFNFFEKPGRTIYSWSRAVGALQWRRIMLTYIVLGSFTDQGLKAIKDSTKRADAAKEMAARSGVNMREIYWTQGQYDLVTICEADNEAAISAFGLSVGGAGNVRFQTLRAFTKDEMNGILAKLP